MTDYTGQTAKSPNAGMTKAQKFEDEKKRIISSCFSKLDPNDKSILESYITHCRIFEDASNGLDPAQRKARVILVAVKKTGRVRMHKARENANGSFSIGKTWNLDDLSQIENHGERAFTVTIIKPYYWEANSLKEKEFFIQSILKIYRKYTGGKTPTLIGFEGLDVRQSGESSSAPSTTRAASPAVAAEKEQQQQNTHIPPSLQVRAPPPQIQTSFARSPSNGPQPQDKGYLNQPKDTKNLRAQQSQPAIRGREDYNAAPANSPLRSMHSAQDLGPGGSVPIQAQYQGKQGGSGATAAPAFAERRRPSDASSRSGISASNLPRPGSSSSAAAAARTSEDQRSADNKSIRTMGSVDHTTQPEPLIPVPVKAREPPPPIIPPPIRTLERASPLTPTPPPVPQDDSKHQPVKKKSTGDIAGRFRMAATAYNASSLLNKNKSPTTPSTPSFSPISSEKFKIEPGKSIKDKISGPIVMEPPPKHERRMSITTGGVGGTVPPSPYERKAPGLINKADISAPSQKSRPSSPLPSTASGTPRASFETSEDRASRSVETPDTEKLSIHRRSGSPTQRLKKQKAVKDSVLDDLDYSQLTVNIDQVLKEFNWDWRGRVDTLEQDVKRELAAVEAKNVLINPGSDERLETLSQMFDQAIEECEKLDGLLTLYAVELTSLTDDIAHIENQSQGLQVQTANQKTLQKELERLLSTVSISSDQLEALKQGSLESPQGLERIEGGLLALYKAMLTIDPSSARGPKGSVEDDENVGSIRALQERKEGFKLEIKEFLRRFRQFMNIKFQAEIVELQKLVREQDNSGAAGRLGAGAKPRLIKHESAYKTLFKFAGLVLFAKEIDREEFTELQKLYERPSRAVFQEELRDFVFAWKRIARKTTAEEAELVFTVPEKESDRERLTTTVRTLTVKRSQNLARTLRSPMSSEFPRDVKKDPQEGKLDPYEAFSEALEEIVRQVAREQNFVIEFFHLDSRQQVSFEEFVQTGGPVSRHHGDLDIRRPLDQDRMTGRMVLEYLGEVFSFLSTDIGGFIDWAVKNDPLQGVGVLHTLERITATLEDTDQEFLIRTLTKLREKLVAMWGRFLDDQVKAIEDTKVKIKKRKGVIPFMRIFPQFAARIEDMLPHVASLARNPTGADIRALVDKGYVRLNKAMFESLQAIAKEAGFGLPVGSVGTGGGAHGSGVTVVSGSSAATSAQVDPEDKEQLNYHIMMIENMNHYVEDVDTRGNVVLEEFMRKAEGEYREHLGMYVGAVVRRPLGKLLDFVESIESQLALSPSLTIEEISSRASHSRHVLKKLLNHYDAKEMRRGIETLRKRVDKHFAEGDDADTSRRLLAKMSRELMQEYLGITERIKNIIVGGGAAYQGLEVEWQREDVVNGFTK